MTIRTLHPADASAFQALRLQALLEIPDAFASSHEEEYDTPVEVIAERLAPRADRAVFGAFRPGARVGIVGLRRETPRKLAHKANLWGMYVAPPARRQGMAQALLAAALQLARTKLQALQVNLGVNALNTGPIALYERAGFRSYGIERRFMIVDDLPQDEVKMVRFLDGP